jgi:ferredoxin/flavodoxin
VALRMSSSEKSRKIRKIIIFYFSGTGNTQIVADLYEAAFENYDIIVDTLPIEDVIRNVPDFDFGKYDIMGLGHPVHAFRPPSILFSFIENLPRSIDMNAFLFKTMGDPLFYGGPTQEIRKKLKKKGLHVFHEDFLVMPSNIIIDYDPQLKKQLYLTAKRKINIYTLEILQGKQKLQSNPGYLRAMSRIFGWMESWGAKYFGKFLHASNACNKCGRCVQKCPTNNIQFINDGLEFGDNCLLCMRCVYICPRNALKNKYMNFFMIKGGYDFKEAITNGTISSDFITKDTKGYFKHFYTYLTHELY